MAIDSNWIPELIYTYKMNPTLNNNTEFSIVLKNRLKYIQF